MPANQSGAVRISLYVRSINPRGVPIQRRLLDRLDDLGARGLIESYDVTVVGDRLPATPAAARTAFGQRMIHRVVLFREWASRNDVDLTPDFEQIHIESPVLGETVHCLSPPEVLLATYEGARLSMVTPHTVGDDYVGPLDEVDRLESGAGRAGYVPLGGVSARDPVTEPDVVERAKTESRPRNIVADARMGQGAPPDIDLSKAVEGPVSSSRADAENAGAQADDDADADLSDLSTDVQPP